MLITFFCWLLFSLFFYFLPLHLYPQTYSESTTLLSSSISIISLFFASSQLEFLICFHYIPYLFCTLKKLKSVGFNYFFNYIFFLLDISSFLVIISISTKQWSLLYSALFFTFTSLICSFISTFIKK